MRMSAATWPTSCLSIPETTICVGAGTSNVMPSGGSMMTGCEKPAAISSSLPLSCARYPTPTGSYRIVNKQSNPTWTPPPDSDWAKGLGPIPPGPGNPLGTRWMGTSAPYVGFHGTPASGTIGTRASHGCIRMRIPDAEALYEEVVVGMPVQISY